MTAAQGSKRWSTRVAVPLLGLLGAFALFRVIELAWTCDDAFISYRYAKHLIEWRGFVFNVGERVEAYTNPLFTLVIAAAMACGAEPRVASMTVGAVAYFFVAWTLAAWSRERAPVDRWWLPFGALLWLTQDDLHTWATGGLETTMFAALALAGIRCTTRTPHSRRGLLLGGTWLSLASLTRPDGVLFAAIGVLGVITTARLERRAWREIARSTAAVCVPLVFIGGAFVGFKLWYYGRILPTTFYAKSASEPYYSQGLVYVALYAAKHWAMSLAVVFLPIAVVASRNGRSLLARRDAFVSLSVFAGFSAYVAHSGGDYMFARRLIPALPFLFVFLDAALAVLPKLVGASSVVALTAASFFPYRLVSEDGSVYGHGITEERWYYPEAVIDARRRQAMVASKFLGGLDLRASFAGGMCMFAYYSDLPYLIEPNGLTQYWAAERHLDSRGREKIGHEKSVSRDELRRHGATLIFHQDLPPISAAEPRFDEIFFGRTLRVEMLTYDEALMARLGRSPEVAFHRIDDTLREAAADIGKMSCDDARASLASLSSFYLDRHPGEAAPIRAASDAACAQR
jgi:hypothetical protein